MALHFYSRTRPNAHATMGTYPGGVFTADGRMHIGIPVRSVNSHDRTSRTDPLSSLATDAPPSGGVYVLMFPSAPDAENASRSSLLLALLIDTAALVMLLLEMGWRAVHVSYLSGLCISGLVTDVVGFASCIGRQPSLLGIFGLICAIQLFVSALPSQSLAQLIHCAMQPVLVSYSLTLRKARIPQWFNTGRVR